MEAPKKTGIFHIGGVSKEQLKEQLEILRTVNSSMEQRLQDQQNRLLDRQKRDRDHEMDLQTQRKRTGHLELNNTKLKEEKGIIQAKVQALSGRLTASNTEIDALRGEIKTLSLQLQASKQDAQSARADIDLLNNINNDRREVILTHEDTVLALMKERESLQQRQRNLEEILVQVNKQPGKFALDDFEENAASKHEVAEDGDWSRKIEVLIAENTHLRQMYTDLQEERAALHDNWPKTLRSLLTVKAIEIAFPFTTIDDTRSSIQLDKAMSPIQLLDQLATILRPSSTSDSIYQRLRLQECMLCSKVKFFGDFQGPPLDWLYEFPAQGSKFFPCCHKDICRQCFLDHLSNSIRYGWWCKLGSLRWLACPKAGCDRPLDIRCEADLQICLERNRDSQVEELSKM
jgi:outer membrane murein-binding lipoprotein Lpp